MVKSMVQLVTHHAPTYRVHGRLALQFKHVASTSATVLHITEQTPPLRVVRAFQNKEGMALVHLHNVSGGVLGGDNLTLNVLVGSHSRAQLTTPGATRIYRRQSDYPGAIQQQHFTVEAHALLEYLPDPIIPFAGACFRQVTEIQLAEGAGLFWWEIVAPGREALQESFAYETLEMSVDIKAHQRPIAIERVQIQPGLRPLTSLARLGPYRYFATFYICQVGQPEAAWLALEQELSELAQEDRLGQEITWAANALPCHGLVIRGLSSNGWALRARLVEIWRLAKWRLYQELAIPPRKLY